MIYKANHEEMPVAKTRMHRPQGVIPDDLVVFLKKSGLTRGGSGRAGGTVSAGGQMDYYADKSKACGLRSPVGTLLSARRPAQIRIRV